MLFISHILSSFLILYALASTSSSVEITPLTLTLSVFFAVLPDLDFLFSKTMKDHHNTFLHAPLFWAAMLLIGINISQNTQNPLVYTIVLLLFVQTTTHLFFDFLTARTTGIQLLSPFSYKNFSLFTIVPEKGDFHPILARKDQYAEYFRHYFKNKKALTFEILVSAAGIIVLLI